MIKTVLFLHDTSLETPRGAELTLKQLISLGKNHGFKILFDPLNDLSTSLKAIQNADISVISSTSRCAYESELIDYFSTSTNPYIKIEYDYNFCVRRNILCTVNSEIRNCCDPEKFHRYRTLFANAALNIFQSPKHYQAHQEFYGEAVSKHKIMPPTVDIDNLKPNSKKTADTVPFFGDLNYLKGGKAFISYAKKNPTINFVVYGKNCLREIAPSNIHFKKPIPNIEVLKILGQTKTIFCQPVWPEPSGRLAAEAFLSGCEILGNDRIGTFSFDFYPDSKEKAIQEIQEALNTFWEDIKLLLKKTNKPQATPLNKVLVYKSYGGLGDIFFAIPAINKLADVSNSLHFAVAPRLVSFFKQHLPKVKVVNETLIKKQEQLYDTIYELGNYPAFRGYDLPHALRYPTHKRVKQHAIQHYIDTVAKLHINIDNTFRGYPFFKQTKAKKNYYVIHHGAGFLLKIWPTKKYAELIEKLYCIFPNLGCKIIKGPKDPEIESYFSQKLSHIEYVTGDIDAVGQAMSGALFHIGNDAGITHVAGAYNIPTVGIYGPTGPGSWGSFAENNKLIWGKKGVCNIKCNYDVILNCEHRICLTSITINRVVEALFSLLQDAYCLKPTKLKINPQLEVDFSEKDCLLKIEDRSLLLEFHNQEMKAFIKALLLEETIIDSKNVSFLKTYEVLKTEHVIFEVPLF